MKTGKVVYEGKIRVTDFMETHGYVDLEKNPLYETDGRVIYERLAANDYRITSNGEKWLEVFYSPHFSDEYHEGKPPSYGNVIRISANTRKRTLCVANVSLCYRPQFKDYIRWPYEQSGYEEIPVDRLLGADPATISWAWDVFAVNQLGLKVCAA